MLSCSLFKFIFTLGWFKTAASLLNPLGDDAEAVPTGQILDENISIAIQSGGAGDKLYPTSLQHDGDANEQLGSLEAQPNFETLPDSVTSYRGTRMFDDPGISA